MPELPEVESARALCEEHCLGATVVGVAFLEDGSFDEKIFAGTTAKAFKAALMGRTLGVARRLGKHMWWEMHGGGAKTPESLSPLFHFGMTGAMSVKGEGASKYKSFVVDTSSWPPRFAKLVVTFDNGVSAALDGSFSWLLASELVSGYASDTPSAVSADATLGTLTLLANSKSQVVLTLTMCDAATVDRSVWANLLPAANDLDLATSSLQL